MNVDLIKSHRILTFFTRFDIGDLVAKLVPFIEIRMALKAHKMTFIKIDIDYLSSFQMTVAGILGSLTRFLRKEFIMRKVVLGIMERIKFSAYIRLKM